MNILKWIFGGSSSGKSVAETVADVADNYKPGEVTKHNMSIEDQKAGDDSQNSARQMVLLSGGDNWFDIAINGLNRMPRPIVTGWVICILFGWVNEPEHLLNLNPITLNIIWTVITFWFGGRLLVKDIPTAIMSWRKK